jgi:hypothetical protein
VWQRYNQYTEIVSELSIRVFPSHSYNAGRAGLGWGLGGSEELCALHAVTVWWFWY